MKVEVEIEDLETIIFSTAVIKNIETLLAARKTDPFVKPHLDYNRAHDALVLAMNSARRFIVDTKIDWGGKLSDKEFALLKQFASSDVFEIDGEFRKKKPETDTLAAKGCLRIGQMVKGAVWPGEQRPDIQPIAGYALAITKRGREKLESALHADKS